VEEFLETVERIKNGNPGWFGPWLEAEQIATRLRYWEPFLIPGVLQCESYMRVLERSDEVVRRRLERQKQVLGRAQVTAVIGHRALVVALGSPAVMAEQLGHLATLIVAEKIRVHIVPEGTSIGLGGALAIASHKGLVTVSMSTTTRDITSTAVDMAEEAMAAFDEILGTALAPVPSLEYIRQMEETWKERLRAGGKARTR
jgi:hypothetical protein